MKIPASDEQVRVAVYKLFEEGNGLSDAKFQTFMHDVLLSDMEEWLVKNKARAGKLIWASRQDITQAKPVMEELLRSTVNAELNVIYGEKTDADCSNAGAADIELAEGERLELYCKITQIQKVYYESYQKILEMLHLQFKRVVEETKRKGSDLS